jgi:hypothetical protein
MERTVKIEFFRRDAPAKGRNGGHQERFLPPRLDVRCRFSQATFAATRGNGRDAPIAVADYQR